MSATVNKMGTEANVTVPSFTTDDLDRTGNTTVEQTLKWG